jgi:hypothetical protein
MRRVHVSGQEPEHIDVLFGQRPLQAGSVADFNFIENLVGDHCSHPPPVTQKCAAPD